MPDITEIHLKWEGPLTFDQIRKLTGKTDRGIYQIYSHHHVYGSDVLLYIGKAENTFAARITRNRWELNPDFDRLQIYVGRIEDPAKRNDDELKKQIDLAERLLIRSHHPAWNAQTQMELSVGGEAHLFNWGKFRSLFPEVSTARWGQRFWSQEMTWRLLGESVETQAEP